MEDKIVLSTLDDSFPLQHLFPFIFLGQFILSPSLSPYFLRFSFSSFLCLWGITHELFTMIYNKTFNQILTQTGILNIRVEIYRIIEKRCYGNRNLITKRLVLD